MSSELTHREALPSDAPLLELWDTYDHVIDSDPDDDWNWNHELQRTVDWRVQWMFLVHGQAMGFVQIIDPEFEESQYWGATGPGYRAIDIWIGPREFIGKGYGTKMMQRAIEYCFSDSSVHSILIDPLITNKGAIAFYQKLGFVFLENRNFGDSHCAVHILRR